MKIVYHPIAAMEVKEATSFYGGRQSPLGKAFLHALKHTVETIREFPNGGTRVSSQHRRYLISRFPYTVIYRHLDKGILIVSVYHTSRDPRILQERMENK